MTRRTARSVFVDMANSARRTKSESQVLELLECGVDYVTATATKSSKEKALYELGYELVQEEAAAGNDVCKWQGLGYHGRSSGSASVGTGSQGVLVRVSAGLAAERWRELVHWSTNITRIDTQVTLKLREQPDAFIISRWEEARRHWLQHSSLCEPKLRSGVNGAETIQLGSRLSERCGRIYDKGKESKLDHYQGCVRFESEFKGKVAKAVSSDLLRRSLSRTEVIRHVLGFFRKQRISLEVVGYEPTFIKGPRRVSDRRRKLEYLEKSIKPLVQSLICTGESAEVLIALGLSDWTSAKLDQPETINP